MWGTPRAYLWVTIVVGEHAGASLYRPYRVAKVNTSGKRRNGGFDARPRQTVTRDLARLLGPRFDRHKLSLAPLHGLLLEVEIKTVTQTDEGDELPEPLQYSRVSKVLRILDEDGGKTPANRYAEENRQPDGTQTGHRPPEDPKPKTRNPAPTYGVVTSCSSEISDDIDPSFAQPKALQDQSRDDWYEGWDRRDRELKPRGR